MQNPNIGVGSFHPDPEDVQKVAPTDDTETLGMDDVAADAAASGAEGYAQQIKSHAATEDLGWNEDPVADPEAETVGSADARADAINSGGDPDKV